MSIINEALKKVETGDKRGGERPPLPPQGAPRVDEMVNMETRQKTPDHKTQWLILMSVIVFVALSGVWGWVFWNSSSSQKEQRVTPLPPVVSQMPSAEVASLPLSSKAEYQAIAFPKKVGLLPISLPPFDLQGVVSDRERPLAIVNDTIVGLGDAVAGATVVSIDSTTVTLSYRGREVVLRLQ